jgi:hypothetical protein
MKEIMKIFSKMMIEVYLNNSIVVFNMWMPKIRRNFSSNFLHKSTW